MNLAKPNAKSAARSCTTCSKAKAKCVKQPGAHSCDRCARLTKECHTKEPVLRRKKPTKTTRAAQLEKLEHKIEHLVNALSSNPQQVQSYRQHDHERPSPPMSQVSSTVERGMAISARPGEMLEAICHGPEPKESSASPDGPPTQESAGTTPNDASQHPRTVSSLIEMEVLLDRYIRLMSPGLPSVVVPDNSSAQSMQEYRPVLLQAICVVSSYHHLAKQQTLLEQAIADIGERVLVKNEKSIDILQAILVITAWYHPHIFWGNHLTLLLHIAMAITVDLGIDRLSQLQDFGQATTKAMHGPCLSYRVPSLEERRVLLGLFYKTSMLSCCLSKINAMPFTPYMEDCLSALRQAREYDSDLSLVQLVEIQRIIQTAHNAETSNVPPKMFIKAFQADLARIRKEDQTEGDDFFLQLEYLTAEVFTWELSLARVAESKKMKSLSSHLEDLYQLVDAVRRFFDFWWTIPASKYLILPFSCFGQYAHTFINLTKLANIDIDGWDLKVLNEQVSFIHVIDESARRYEGVPRYTDEDLAINNDAFVRWALKVKLMKQVYLNKSTAAETVCDVDTPENVRDKTVEPDGPSDLQQQYHQQQQHQHQIQQQTPPDDFLSSDFFNYLDESFWNNLAGGDLDMFLQDSLGTLNTVTVGGRL